MEGVKLDFPSGAELLVSPDRRLHLRSGESTLAYFRGLKILLADGTQIRIKEPVGGAATLGPVEVKSAGAVYRLWDGRRGGGKIFGVGVFVAPTLMALGNGEVLYEASASGPLLALQRVLCPEEEAGNYPEQRLVIIGDVLAASLRLLPGHAPKKSVQFPQVMEVAQRLSSFSDELFPKRILTTPPGSIGEPWIELAGGFRLITRVSEGPVMIGLYKETSDTPVVEWQIGGSSKLFFVRPFGGSMGGPRYFLRGLDLRRQVDAVWPIPETFADRKKVRELVQKLDGIVSRRLPVKQQR